MSDPKLLQAMDRIKFILTELDIAGHIVLHNAPGKVEIFTRLDPSYSRLIGLPPVVRLRSKLADYAGDQEAQRRDLEATAGMVASFAEVLATTAMHMMELGTWIDDRLGTRHTPLTADPDMAR
jgi:hypothetical protein